MTDTNDTSLERRNLLIGAGALLGMAAAGPAFAGHEHNHSGADKDLLQSTLHCMNTSQACLAHCIEQFKLGDTEMADCAQSVQESAAMCTAMWQLATLGSKHIKQVAAACLSICETCEKSCDKFADKHEVCKECRDSCTDLIGHLKKIA